MKAPLRLTLFQSQLIWEDIDANLQQFTQKFAAIAKDSTDLILLPEMFTTGFSMNAVALAETMEGKTVNWLREMAAAKGAVVCGSAIIKDGQKYVNRLLWVRPDGTISTYDKRHCFTLAGEHEHFSAGTERLIVTCKEWKICPLICYDLRFPVWSRNDCDYDLLFYIANWPNKRNEAWKSLLRARAIENQAYTVGVNRVGLDEKQLRYSGDSAVIDYAGQIRYQVTEVEDCFSVSLSWEEQEVFRQKLQFLADRDQFEILT